MTYFRQRLCLTCLIFSLFSELPAQGTYQNTIELLVAGRYQQAAQQLESLVEVEPSLAAYSNLALAYFRNHQLGKASLALANAEALGGCAETDALREQLNEQLPAELQALSPNAVDRVVGYLFGHVHENLLAALALIFWLLTAGILLYLLFLQPLHRKRFNAIAFGACALALLFAWGAFRQNQLLHPRRAVVMQATELRTAPSATAPVVSPLPEGILVVIGERLAGHVEVVLPTGQRGWLSLSLIQAVSPLGMADETPFSPK